MKSSKLKYALASQSETKSINGKKGDQTEREVYCRTEYDFGQSWVAIPKSTKIGNRIAKAAIAICDNDNVGYGQNDRTSIFIGLRKLGWKIGSCKKLPKCNTDCSELAVVSVNCAYQQPVLDYNETSRTLRNTLANKPKKFSVQEFKGGMKLKKGSIIGKNGHVVICISNGKTTIYR